jgi:hypothetical protein
MMIPVSTSKYVRYEMRLGPRNSWPYFVSGDLDAVRDYVVRWRKVKLTNANPEPIIVKVTEERVS